MSCRALPYWVKTDDPEHPPGERRPVGDAGDWPPLPLLGYRVGFLELESGFTCRRLITWR